MSEAQRKYYWKNREVVLAKRKTLEGRERCNERAKLWNQNNPDKLKQIKRRTRLKQKYNITPEKYDEMVEAQHGLCAICYQKLKEGKGGMSLDHCHKTGRCRSVLCSSCNKMLGHARDNIAILQLAIDYLLKWRGTD